MDALGVRHDPATPGARIVSLVPSLTELLWDLGLGHLLVARTGFCVHPRDALRGVPKVGGTKDVRIGKIRELAPTHVVVNVDENPKPVVDELARFVPHIIVTHPLRPEDNPHLYRLFGAIFGRASEAESLCRRFVAAREALSAAATRWTTESVLYLIWRAPWMTVSRDTYISRTLALAGWNTVPVMADRRYPEIALTAEALENVDRVLLASEPYPFREKHLQQVRNALPPGCRAEVALIDGEMTSWYGSRAIRGLGYLKEYREARQVA
ncbi:MAG: cobalamin-binding protein [Betaproteobacteria bacterium]|nr:cobalamin-binding protein [Betaproteobacteria bacterium]